MAWSSIYAGILQMLSARSAQSIVLGIYALFALFSACFCISFALRGFADSDLLGTKLAAIYATPIGLALGAILVKGGKNRTLDGRVFTICIVVSLVWNAFVVGFLVYTNARFILLRDTSNNLEAFTVALNFLTAGTFSFLFGKAT